MCAPKPAARALTRRALQTPLPNHPGSERPARRGEVRRFAGADCTGGIDSSPGDRQGWSDASGSVGNLDAKVKRCAHGTETTFFLPGSLLSQPRPNPCYTHESTGIRIPRTASHLQPNQRRVPAAEKSALRMGPADTSAAWEQVGREECRSPPRRGAALGAPALENRKGGIFKAVARPGSPAV